MQRSTILPITPFAIFLSTDQYSITYAVLAGVADRLRGRTVRGKLRCIVEEVAVQCS